MLLLTTSIFCVLFSVMVPISMVWSLLLVLGEVSILARVCRLSVSNSRTDEEELHSSLPWPIPLGG